MCGVVRNRCDAYIKFGRVPLVIVAEPSTSENTFNDLPYFVRIFTKLIGFSTSKYIKQFLKGKSFAIFAGNLYGYERSRPAGDDTCVCI